MTTTTKNDDHSQSIAIMYPADWPADDPEAHCTLYYLGEAPDIEFTPDDLLDALDEAQLVAPGEVPTAGLELFGPEKDIPVALLDSLLLKLQKKMLSGPLTARGIKDGSSFPQYKPHVTMKNPDTEIPPTVTLGAPEVWWGGERISR